MQDHRGDERDGNDNGGRYCKRVRLFLLSVGAVGVVAKFVLYDFVVIRRFKVGEFCALGPAGILVAPAMRAERGVIFQFGVAMRTVHLMCSVECGMCNGE